MLLEHAQVPAMPAGVENMAGELKQEGDRPPHPRDADPGVWWVSPAHSVPPSGFSTWSKPSHGRGAPCPLCTGRGLGSGRESLKCGEWSGSRRGGCRGSRGRRRIPGKVLFFQLSRQEPGQAQAASGGLSLPDVAVPALSAGATPRSYY